MKTSKLVATTLFLALAAGCGAEGVYDDFGTGPGGLGKADDADASVAEADASEADASEGEADAEPEVDHFAEARDVDKHRVVIDPDLPAPAYDYPSADGFRLSGTEFWQKWPDGLNPTYSYSAGTELGRKCMLASAIRFEAIMADPPEALVQLRDESNWGGSFFNWNDDYSLSEWSDGSSAQLWAWRTGLIKWISQTNRDGSCYLPTRAIVEQAAEDCLDTAATDDGEIQGCSG